MGATIYDHLSSLADSTRSRLLLVLEKHELTVGELCSVMQLPQSTVSRHLKTLGDEGWVTSRAEGTSRQYRMLASLEPGARRLWQLVRQQVSESDAAARDARRAERVLAERRARSEEFFSSKAGQWDAMRAELFGSRADLLALLGIFDSSWTVGDLGCGTGEVAETISPFVKRVVAVDSSRAMLAAARRRLVSVKNVDLRQGDLDGLPIEAKELDLALMFHVLQYVIDPPTALRAVRRTLVPNGRALVLDMMPHERDEYQQMGHVWHGFSRDQLAGWLDQAGFTAVRYIPLPPDPQAKGPSLFVATATA